MIVRGVEIKPEHIMSIIPATKSMVIKSRLVKHHEMAKEIRGEILLIKLETEKEIQAAKFEHVQHLKGLPRPEDRAADYECRDDDGSFNFLKMEKLIEMRKTREEKKEELYQEMELMQMMKKRGIEYNGPLKQINGGF